MKRIQFTEAELDLMNDMCAIASAAPWGEGDYVPQIWNEKAGKVFNSLREKIWALEERCGKKKKVA